MVMNKENIKKGLLQMWLGFLVAIGKREPDMTDQEIEAVIAKQLGAVADQAREITAMLTEGTKELKSLARALPVLA